jgi:quinol monooxygenase YgiN
MTDNNRPRLAKGQGSGYKRPRHARGAATAHDYRQEKEPMAIVVIARMKAKAGKEQELEAAFRDMITKVRTEPGCQQYVLHRALKDPTQFAFYEVYADKEALDAHGKTPHMAEMRSKLGGLIESTTLDIMSEIDRR